MTSAEISKMFFTIIGGLGMFLLGMKNMSDGLQGVAGDGLRGFISKLTTNRALSLTVGFLITAFVQSSSVTSVMAVGLVNSGLMSLSQSIGVMMGANIGTTVTGWILVLKIGKYGLPMLGIAALVYLFSKADSWKFWGMAIMGLGMVFFGLQLMKNGFEPFKEVPQFEQVFLKFTADSFPGIIKCVLVGCILTMIVQSSSATLGITMGLAMAGSLKFNTSAALILGQNIGTTITANLASIGTNVTARRAARAHMFFNVIGVLIVILIFPAFLNVIKKILVVDPDAVNIVNGKAEYPHILRGIATTHTGFNIFSTVIFFPFISILEKIVCYVVPEKESTGKSYLTYINKRMIDAPSIAIEQSRNEVIHVSKEVQNMLDKYINAFDDILNKKNVVKKLFYIEEKIDMIQKELLSFLTLLLSQNIPTHLVEIARRQIRLAEEFESISDYIVRILKIHLRLLNANENWSEDKKKAIFSLHGKIMEYLDYIHNWIEQPNININCEMHTESPEIKHMIKDLRTKHLERLSQGNISPMESTSYTDLLTCYRKINDHSYNIMEILCLEK